MGVSTLKKMALTAGLAATACVVVYEVPMVLNSHTRHLTPDEIAFAADIIGPQQLDEITLHQGLRGIEALSMVKPSAVTWGNDIFVRDNTANLDHALCGNAIELSLEHIVHEGRHSQQFASGEMVGQIVKTLNPYTFSKKYEGRYGALYDVDATDKNFSQYNFEQQSVALEDHARHLLLYQKDQKALASVGDSADKKCLYEENLIYHTAQIRDDVALMGQRFPLIFGKRVLAEQTQTAFTFAHNADEIIQRKDKEAKQLSPEMAALFKKYYEHHTIKQ